LVINQPVAEKPMEQKVETLSNQTASSAQNATQEIAKNIAKEIIRQNPEGLTEIKPDQLANEALSKQIQQMDLSDFSPEINWSDLKIINTSDYSIAENYLKNFQAILRNNFNRLSVEFSRPTALDFQKLAEAYRKSVSEFYNLVTPQALAIIHSEQIRLMSVQKAIFENLSDYEKDPIKALVALQLSKEVDEKLNDLKKEIVAYIIKNGLKI
jgi:hypothetical protein